MGLTSGHAGDKQGPHKEPLAPLLGKKHNAPAVEEDQKLLTWQNRVSSPLEHNSEID